MKQFFLLILLFTMTMTTSAQQTLSERQLLLCACASLEAQGDLQRLDPAIRRALDGGVTVNELKEAFSQLYAYTGFPRSLNALGVLSNVLTDRKAQGVADNEGKPFVRPTLWGNAEQALKQGTDVQTQLVGGTPFNYDFCPQDDYYLKSHLFGDIFAGDQLSAADRELVTIAALSSLKGVEPQLASHKAGAVNMGNTKEQVDELCQWLSQNGYSQTDCSADAEAGAWAKGVVNPYSQFFTGQSYLANIRPANVAEGEQTLANYQNVTFEPGCRNNWHIHHGAHQILICVSGRGWYQEWGKEPVELLPGMIIDIPDEVKHWHGAQQNSWFQHLSCIVLTGTEKESHEWLEPVSDEQYTQLSSAEN
ncbi:MAG: carboxymuconolactone decarboxylase family protein [Prevotellaceae bacterium]|nr:carboxymuconolactone decarboxylase family protein [Prevotellaceae bacterium]